LASNPHPSLIADIHNRCTMPDQKDLEEQQTLPTVRPALPSQYILIDRRIHDSVHSKPAFHPRGLLIQGPKDPHRRFQPPPQKQMPTEHRQESKRSARAGFLDQSQKKSTSTKCPPNAKAFHLPHQFCVNSRKSTRLRLEHDLLRSSETQATYFFRGATYFFLALRIAREIERDPQPFFFSVARHSFGYEITKPTSPLSLALSDGDGYLATIGGD